MMAKDFLIWIQSYYGQYLPGQREDVMNYLYKRSPSYLDALKEIVVKRYSRNKDQIAPDVAAFERCKPDTLELHDQLLANQSRATALITEQEDPQTYQQMMECDWRLLFKGRMDGNDRSRDEAIRKADEVAGKQPDIQATSPVIRRPPKPAVRQPVGPPSSPPTIERPENMDWF